MPRTLVIIGLVLIAVALALQLVAALIRIAVPAGLLLVAIGGIWYLVERSKTK